MKTNDGISINAVVLEFPLAEFNLHGCQFLLLLFYFLIQVSILIFQKIQFCHQFKHLDPVFLSAVFQGSQGDVLAGDEVLHVAGVGSLLVRDMVVEVYLFDFGGCLFFLIFHLLLVLDVGDDVGPAVGLLLPLAIIFKHILSLYFLNKFFQFLVALVFLFMISLYFQEFLSFMLHFLSQFEKGLLVAVLIMSMCHSGAILVNGRSIILFKVLYVRSKLFDGLIFQSDGLLEIQKLCFLISEDALLFYFLFALLEDEIDLCDFLFDLLLDVDAADGTEGVEFGFGLAELPDV